MFEPLHPSGKKLLLIGGSLLMALVLAACGGGGGDPPPPQQQPPQALTPQPTGTTVPAGTAAPVASAAGVTPTPPAATAAAVTSLNTLTSGTGPATGTASVALNDLCYLSNGFTNTLSAQDFDANPAAQAYRDGMVRGTPTIASEQVFTNADSSTRTIVVLNYPITYTDGSSEVATTYFIKGSSYGTPGCATTQVGDALRPFGNQHIANVGMRAQNDRLHESSMQTGASRTTTPVQYSRVVDFRMSDVAGVAQYIVVTGPGPVGTLPGGATASFSLKLLSPRILRSDPLLAGKRGNFKNWNDTDLFRICRTATVAEPNAAAADCVGAGASSSQVARFTRAPVAADDTAFDALGFQAGGVYTFSLYNDDGWKTVNGQAGKTPVATYTSTLAALPYTFVQMAGASPATDLFPQVQAVSTTRALVASTLKAGTTATLTATWSAPGAVGSNTFALANTGEFFRGTDPTIDVARGTDPYQTGYRYFVGSYPGGTATSGTFNITAKPAVISGKNFANFSLFYTNRRGNVINSESQFLTPNYPATGFSNVSTLGTLGTTTASLDVAGPLATNGSNVLSIAGGGTATISQNLGSRTTSIGAPFTATYTEANFGALQLCTGTGTAMRSVHQLISNDMTPVTLAQLAAAGVVITREIENCALKPQISVTFNADGSISGTTPEGAIAITAADASALFGTGLVAGTETTTFRAYSKVVDGQLRYYVVIANLDSAGLTSFVSLLRQ
jgi:hypothetical protein